MITKHEPPLLEPYPYSSMDDICQWHAARERERAEYYADAIDSYTHFYSGDDPKTQAVLAEWRLKMGVAYGRAASWFNWDHNAFDCLFEDDAG